MSVLDNNISWIGPGNVFLFGKGAFERQFKDGFLSPMIDLNDAEFYLQKCSDNAYIVIGKDYAYTTEATEYIMAASNG